MRIPMRQGRAIVIWSVLAVGALGSTSAGAACRKDVEGKDTDLARASGPSGPPADSVRSTPGEIRPETDAPQPAPVLTPEDSERLLQQKRELEKEAVGVKD